jgi:release factor glutamine methyltransferase
LNDTYRKLRDRLAAGLSLLPDKPEESPDSTLRALWHTAAGSPKSAVAAVNDELPELTAGEPLQMLEHFIARRLAGEPLAHITGRQRFMGLEMLSCPQALIPRSETEQLAHASIELLQQPSARRPARVIDVGTGSGNLAFAIAHYVPDAQVFGTDISEDAVALAKRNGAHLKLQGRVTFRTGDLLAPFDATADPLQTPFLNGTDMIVCSPPYILSTKVELMAAEIANHEPRLAFDGGPFGVAILLRLIEDAPRFLYPGGWLNLEVGLGQGPAIARRLQRDQAFQEVRSLTDVNEAIRMILARRSSHCPES